MSTQANSLALADHTTMRVGGPAESLLVAQTQAELTTAVRDADAAGQAPLIVGGGSNLVVGDAGYRGPVILNQSLGLQVFDDDDHVEVHVSSGTNWDEFVAEAVAQGWAGVEALSGIPGSVGATPIQNVGAYGQEVATTIVGVRVLDRQSGEVTTLRATDCRFAYRHSVFKDDLGRYVVLMVAFRFGTATGESAPIRYSELARSLGRQVGQTAPLAKVRAAVLELRRGKGMVLDPADHDTWSAGSFFTNPIVATEEVHQLPDDAPRFPAGDGLVKLSAAWLIEHAGFHKGWPNKPDAPASLSTKHTLAVTNRGHATTEQVLDVGRAVRFGVAQEFGITLAPEPNLINCQL